MIAAVIFGAGVLVAAGFVLAAALADRPERERDPFAGSGLVVHPIEGFDDLGPMPPEIAHDEYPGRGFLPAPPAAAPFPPESRPAAVLPARARVTAAGPVLHPPTAPALAVLAAVTAPIKAHLDGQAQAQAEAWDAHVKNTSPWEHDTTWWTLNAIDADVADAEVT